MKVVVTIIGIVVVVAGYIFLSGFLEPPTYSRVDTSHVSFPDKRINLENEPQSAASATEISSVDITEDDLTVSPVNTLPKTDDVTVPVQAPVFGNVLHEVPFTAQAPFGDWSDPRQQDGCEETAALMAVRWARSETLTKDQALKEITAMADWEKEQYGSYVDTSVEDTADRIIKNYLKYENYEIKYEFSKEDLIAEINRGSIVLTPVKGRELGSPYYTPPGPERHMLLITGYDNKLKQFITNDPGTRHGSKLRYNEDVLYRAINDYPSGNHLPITKERKAMIVVNPAP